MELKCPSSLTFKINVENPTKTCKANPFHIEESETFQDLRRLAGPIAHRKRTSVPVPSGSLPQVLPSHRLVVIGSCSAKPLVAHIGEPAVREKQSRASTCLLYIFQIHANYLNTCHKAKAQGIQMTSDRTQIITW